MSTMDQLIRHEGAHSRLAFRRELYRAEDDAEAVIDCLALANAEVSGRRYLFLGVDDRKRREIVGVDKLELERFRRRFLDLIAAAVEPALDVVVRAVEIDGRLVGYLRIKDSDSPPYLATRNVGKTLKAGMGFIRRGTSNDPLQRSDLKRMFAAAASASEPARESAPATSPEARPQSPIRIGFLGREPLDRLTLPSLPLNKLPSQIAAERLKSLVAVRDQSRDAFGRTETHLARLTHARLFGMDVPFEKRSDDSLVVALGNIATDYHGADEHYMYEVRAHKLNLMLANDTQNHLHDVVVSMSMPRMQGTGISDRIYAESAKEPTPQGYPEIVVGPRTLTLKAELGTVYGAGTVRVLREPLRFWARDEAVGKTVPVDYEIRAAELEKPISGNLAITIDRGDLKSV